MDRVSQAQTMHKGNTSGTIMVMMMMMMMTNDGDDDDDDDEDNHDDDDDDDDDCVKLFPPLITRKRDQLIAHICMYMWASLCHVYKVWFAYIKYNLLIS